MPSRYLGIEIGGTKLQAAVGDGSGPTLIDLERRQIDRSQGAAGIRSVLTELVHSLLARHSIDRIGIGFGGPVDAANGVVRTSHQVAGWDQFPIVDWCREQFGLPARLGNDCDCAALGESMYGAGRNQRICFYVTIGTGIGGGLVSDGVLFGQHRPAVAEIGHLRIDFLNEYATESISGASSRMKQTVESVGAGPGISSWVSSILESGQLTGQEDALAQLRQEASRGPLETKRLGELAHAGNAVAIQAFERSARAVGWAIAQTVTLTAADVVIVGGGVPLAGELYFRPLRESFREYVFGPLRDCTSIVPAALGEEVVLHGAIALSRMGD